MSVTWSRDSAGNDWGGGSEWGFPNFSQKSKQSKRNSVRLPDKNDSTEVVLKSVIPNTKSNSEGYSGNPTSFIDVSDKRVSKYQEAYSERGRAEFRKNIGLVGNLIQCGVVMPTEQLALKSVELLRKIARGENG